MEDKEAERWQDEIFNALTRGADRYNELVAILGRGTQFDRIVLTNPLLRAINDYNVDAVRVLLQHGAVLTDTDMARSVLNVVLGVGGDSVFSDTVLDIAKMLLRADEVTRETTLINGKLTNVNHTQLIHEFIDAGIDIHDISYTKTNSYHWVPVDSIYRRTISRCGKERAREIETRCMVRNTLFTVMLHRVDFDADLDVAPASGGHASSKVQRIK